VTLHRPHPGAAAPGTLQRIRATFEQIVDAGEAERSGHLDRICAGHPQLRREIEALLAEADRDRDADALRPAPTTEPDPDAAPPPRIAGFAQIRPLGRGGMSEVFSAIRERDGRSVAIKVPDPSRRGVTLRRFLREARILRRLDHPSIVRLLDEGRHGTLPYLVLELVEGGRPIDAFVANGRLDLRGTVALAIEVADALAHAHRLGFVHRDLKAGNVLVCDRGRPKLLDFGIAKAQRRDLEASLVHTTAEQVLGSLEVMSPEQTRLVEAPVDTRSDIYQFGLLLQRMALRQEGRPDPRSSMQRLQALAHGAAVGPIPGERAIAKPLRRILQAALRPHPEDRYQRMDALAEDLRALLAGALRRPTAPPAVQRTLAALRRRLLRARRGPAVRPEGAA
jgi:serine/threonine protein kinase